VFNPWIFTIGDKNAAAAANATNIISGHRHCHRHHHHHHHHFTLTAKFQSDRLVSLFCVR